ncbi:hypothetical protein HHL22_15510 [Hymenobacter sp. RP-2-7]|uniref:Lipoprotein n=1 Tax=Hymenobacter polaris TaxID=2682546 RepID=A0A7Y0FNP7_9BACT|nr:hypothetical protein [Hymenobacter polaris]NML66614.1 hypothetical protein [Hymenobacter polaris]
MLRKLLLALLGSPLLVLLAGCCGNTPCDCQDLLADSLYFSFRTQGANAFSNTEIATVYLARYDSTRAGLSLDSLPLVRSQRVNNTLKRRLAASPISVDTTGLLILSNNAPFAAATAGGNISRYRYRLYVPQDSAGTFKKHTFTTFSLDRIRVIGRYQADGCCTCYENSLKRVRILGGNFTDPNIITNTTEAGSGSNRVPVVIQLTK